MHHDDWSLLMMAKLGASIALTIVLGSACGSTPDRVISLSAQEPDTLGPDQAQVSELQSEVLGGTLEDYVSFGTSEDRMAALSFNAIQKEIQSCMSAVGYDYSPPATMPVPEITIESTDSIIKVAWFDPIRDGLPGPTDAPLPQGAQSVADDDGYDLALSGDESSIGCLQSAIDSFPSREDMLTADLATAVDEFEADLASDPDLLDSYRSWSNCMELETGITFGNPDGVGAGGTAMVSALFDAATRGVDVEADLESLLSLEADLRRSADTCDSELELARTVRGQLEADFMAEYRQELVDARARLESYAEILESSQ